MITRRKLITALAIAPVAPAIVRASSLMPIKPTSPRVTARWSCTDGGILIPPDIAERIIAFIEESNRRGADQIELRPA